MGFPGFLTTSLQHLNHRCQVFFTMAGGDGLLELAAAYTDSVPLVRFLTRAVGLPF